MLRCEEKRILQSCEPLTASSRGAHRLQHNVIHPASVTACIGLFKLGDGECQFYFPQPSLTPRRRACGKVLELRHRRASQPRPDYERDHWIRRRTRRNLRSPLATGELPAGPRPVHRRLQEIGRQPAKERRPGSTGRAAPRRPRPCRRARARRLVRDD
jgi:hypothetical protein